MNNRFLACFAAAMTVIAACGIGTSIHFYRQLKSCSAPAVEKTQEEQDREIVAAIANANPDSVKDASTDGEKNDGSALASTNTVDGLPTLKLIDAKYSGGDEIVLSFTERPDMDVVRQYITVEPMNSGVPSFRYTTPFDYSRDDFVPTIRITGDFAFRTNFTVRIRKGFPSISSKTVKPFAEERSFEFSRNDLPLEVAFADRGRYLPPAGDRSIGIKSVNAPSVRTRVSIIPPGNVVHLLSVEEEEYKTIAKDYWSEGEEFARDLSGVPEEMTYSPGGEPNVYQTKAFRLPAENGLYFVQIEGVDTNEVARSGGCRIVAITDIGLTVRETDSSPLVWATSLTDGLPIAGAKIYVYSSANVLVFTGVTNEKGLCRPDRVAKGEPFTVVAKTADDASFMPIRYSMKIDESGEEGELEAYLKSDELSAFAWTERGIYRHGETILFASLIRTAAMKAPASAPFVVRLVSPSDQTFAEKTIVSDESGAILDESFSVPESQPSGIWRIEVRTPGKNGVVLAKREVKIEEFAPPQIRVKVACAEGKEAKDFSFKVAAEHLYGGAAKGLKCEGAVVFEDVPFAPAAWKGYRFGSDDRALKPSFRRLGAAKLDDKGTYEFASPLWQSSGLPSAAIRATCEGTVFEDGGRPATSRGSTYIHYYPFYIGSTLPSWLSKPDDGAPEIKIACVLPDGRMLEEPRKLLAKIERVDYAFAYRRDERGWATWDTQRVRNIVAENIEITTSASEPTRLELRLDKCADYVLTIIDPETKVEFSKSFYLSDWGDKGVRASLSKPEKVSITADKAVYRPGDEPHLIIKAPFEGTALVTVMRDRLLYSEIVAFTNATSEMRLPAATAEWWPSVDVSICVVHGVQDGEKHMAARAHGEARLRVLLKEHEIPVELDAQVKLEGDDGSKVAVDIAAPGFEDEATAIVTIVDEGINLLTDEPVPSPVDTFSRPRSNSYGLYDLYHRLLPVLGDDVLRVNGVKTGGGFGAELLSRISPVPTRRFKPLSMWEKEVKLSGGRGHAEFSLPEFVGEIRVTALVYTATATGAAAVHKKVTPKIVAQPDAPRFVAPGDAFDITLPISNRSRDIAEVTYRVSAGGCVALDMEASGSVCLAPDDQILLNFRARAVDAIGEGELEFEVSGAGERHFRKIDLPVRPAAPWVETAGVERLAPGKTLTIQPAGQMERLSYSVSASRLAELAASLQWLADYPHGCLEQTVSRIFPLIAAQGILNSVEGVAISNREEFVRAGVRRVESMIRANDFVMWPDCDYAPWDREISLYAAHFLVEASKAGLTLNPVANNQIRKFLRKWACSDNSSDAAYACHTLALMGEPDKDRMLSLYDKRDSLTQLDRARLARAFIASNDPKRAASLAATLAAPSNIKDAAFTLLALLEMDPDDAAVPSLVTYLLSNRDKQLFSWGTTSDNAHALLAIGAYYSRITSSASSAKGVKGLKPVMNRKEDGSIEFANPGSEDAFVFWRRLSLPDVAAITNSSSLLSIERTWCTPEGGFADIKNLTRGEALVCEITLKSSVKREYADLVIEDLLPSAFEPVHSAMSMELYPWIDDKDDDWLMRSDARDDRMLAFSRCFTMEAGQKVVFRYPVRVVNSGDFAIPPCTVEAMYAPEIRASTASGRIVVEH